ncbi:MAG: DNA polymerase III subunit delta' [Desulfomonile sp.]|nr:DNA polymerase III subunit delta' [Desulfomonile sp.]
MYEVVGHDGPLEILTRAALEDRPAHAYLFTGRDGVGKCRVAVLFACLVNCPNPLEDLHRSCSVCRRIIEEKHPDVTIERPIKGRIRIERIRSLQGYFRYAPVEARNRVVIIDDAHLMNKPAQNSLLKTLEEPPPGRILVLVTSKPAELLPTVRSRCRRIRFGPVPTGALTHLLAERLRIPSEKAAVLAGMAGGSVGRALQMERTHFTDLRERIVSVLATPGAIGIAGLLELSEKLSAEKETALEAVNLAASWVRDLVVQRIGADSPSFVNVDSLDRIAETAQHHKSGELFAVYDELLRAAELIEADINVNRNLVMDVTLLRITRLLAGPTMGVIAEG